MTVWLRRFRTAFYFGLLLLGLAAAGLWIFFFVTLRDLPQVPEPLSRIIETPPTEIYAASGERIMLIGGREAVPLNRVSPFFIQAVIATEDHRFWDHRGIDKLRLVKAFWVNLFGSGRVEGASTITQQLAKNLFFTFQRTYQRKFRELLVALQIEARYGKNEILEAYVNQIAFGVGAHGIEQASQVFFGKPALQLNLAEAALLAGLPKSPTRYNPFRHFERAKERQKVVLSRMVAVGSISAAEAAQAYQTRLDLRPPRQNRARRQLFPGPGAEGSRGALRDRCGPPCRAEGVYHLGPPAAGAGPSNPSKAVWRSWIRSSKSRRRSAAIPAPTRRRRWWRSRLTPERCGR